MLRISILLLVFASPVLAQYYDGPLATRPRTLDRPISTGLVLPELPDEALIDREAWLREPIPTEELSLLRAGFRRPARGTVWRDPITLPSEEPQYDLNLAVRDTVLRMQGLWRVQTMMVDGQVIAAGPFTGLNYKVTDTVVDQSATFEPMARGYGPTGPSQLQTGLDSARDMQASSRQLDGTLRYTRDYRESWSGVTARDRQAGEVMDKYPLEVETTRQNVVFRGPGQAIVYSWDRYGESRDPYNLLNRPSERVVLSSLGAIEVYEDRIMLAVRAVGARGFLPDHLRAPLGEERMVFFRLGRDEQISNSYNFAPPVGPATGDMARLLDLDQAAVTPEAVAALIVEPAGNWPVRPPTHIDFTPPKPKNVLAHGSQDKADEPRRNVISQMHKVTLNSTDGR
jgi:hypothetical protein